MDPFDNIISAIAFGAKLGTWISSVLIIVFQGLFHVLGVVVRFVVERMNRQK